MCCHVFCRQQEKTVWISSRISRCPMHSHRRRFVSKLGGGLAPLPLFFPLLFFPPFLLFSLSPFPPLSCYTLFVPPFHLPFLFPLNQSMGERCDLLTFVFSVLYKCSYLLTYLSSPSGVRGGALAGRRRILCILTAGKSWLNADGGKCMKTYDKKFTNFFTLAKLSWVLQCGSNPLTKQLEWLGFNGTFDTSSPRYNRVFSGPSRNRHIILTILKDLYSVM